MNADMDRKGAWSHDVPMVDSPTSGNMSGRSDVPVEQVANKGGNNADAADVYRMGKVQETQRNFRFVSIFGYVLDLCVKTRIPLADMIQLYHGADGHMGRPTRLVHFCFGQRWHWWCYLGTTNISTSASLNLN